MSVDPFMSVPIFLKSNFSYHSYYILDCCFLLPKAFILNLPTSHKDFSCSRSSRNKYMYISSLRYIFFLSFNNK